ncbi:MAG TPA: GspH/FimT family pseudopilin [Tepidisphaeraceae bacterium]|jgi:prepilin-type N-terminal cleavage/methylation domain-containing protein
MRRRPNNFAGFTLLELVLVLAILTIVVALVAPSFRGFTAGRRADDTATLIVSLANYARTQAVTEGRTYRLNFDPAARAMWLTADDEGTFVAPSNDFGRRCIASEGVQMEADVPRHDDGQYVEFHPTGRTDAAHILLTNSLGDSIDVACSSATELFRILPPGEATP